MIFWEYFQFLLCESSFQQLKLHLNLIFPTFSNDCHLFMIIQTNFETKCSILLPFSPQILYRLDVRNPISFRKYFRCGFLAFASFITVFVSCTTYNSFSALWEYDTRNIVFGRRQHISKADATS